MKELLYSIPGWVWWIIGIIVIMKLLSIKLDAIHGELDHINRNLVVISNNQLDQLESLGLLKKIEDKLDDVGSLSERVDKLENLDELVWWEKDKTTFASHVIDLLEKISQK
jgi:hypothetical protein